MADTSGPPATLVPDRLLAVCGGRLKRDERLGPYVSFLIGGPADLFVAADSVELAREAIAAAREAGLPWLVLGRGSNVLVSDRGVRGLVVRLQASATSVDEATGAVHAEAGARLAHLAVATAARGLAGLEFAVGIPGSVGGAVVMNAGANGGCVGDALVGAAVLGPEGGVRPMAREELELGYRTSRFHRIAGEVVLAANFQLRQDDPAAVLGRARAFRQRRQATQPTDPGAGSIFKNPVGAPAGHLVEQAGLKGMRVGGAVVSPRHGNFIVNVGGATAADVAALIGLVRAAVERRSGIRLEREVELVGDWRPEELP